VPDSATERGDPRDFPFAGEFRGTSPGERGRLLEIHPEFFSFHFNELPTSPHFGAAHRRKKDI